MRRLSMTGALATLAFIAAGMPASAHHSVHAVFDMKKPITVTGSITRQGRYHHRLSEQAPLPDGRVFLLANKDPYTR